MPDKNAYLDAYLAGYRPYKTYWNYEDGCVLKGAIDLYHATGGQRYRDFVLDYLARYVTPEGEIPNYETRQYNIDSINCGKALFFALDETGDARYQKAIAYHMQRLREHPRCQCGSFWHKELYPNQIWLDGLYMAEPFYMAYEMRFGGMQNVGDIMLQFENVRRFLFDMEKGLFYHAFDEARIQPWANPQTGCSANFWLRSMGWFLMAMVDCLALMDEQLYEHYRALQRLLKDAVHGILPYRDAQSGLFLQVIDHPQAEGNYLETSGTAMIAYTLMKGAAIGALNAERYAPIGRDIFERLAAQKLIDGEDGQAHLVDICWAAGLGPGDTRDGSVAYYLSEPRVADDSKGVGPFMMAYAQWLMGADA